MSSSKLSLLLSLSLCVSLCFMTARVLSYSSVSGTCTATRASVSQMCGGGCASNIGNGGFVLSTGNVNQYTVGGSAITLTVSNSFGTSYEGLLLYAEDSNGNRVGALTFDSNKYQVMSSCGGSTNSTICHRNPNAVNSATFTWRPPATDSGAVNFKAVFAVSSAVWFVITPVCVSSPTGSCAGAAPTPAPTPAPAQSFCVVPLTGDVYSKCIDLSSSPKLTMYWNITQSNSIQMAFYTTNAGWTGFAFTSSARMIGAHAFIYGNSGNTRDVFEYYLSAEALSGVNRVNVDSLTSKSSISSNGATVYSFTRPLSTSDYTINPNADTSIIWAFGNTYVLSEHNRYASGQLNLASGVLSESEGRDLRSVHGILMVIGWGILIPIGIYVARFERSWPNALWFQLHRIIQATGFVFFIAGFGVIVHYVRDRKRDHFLPGHAAAGLALTILGVIQMFGGIFRVAKEKPFRKQWEWGHRFSGFVILIFAIVMVFTGMNKLDVSNGYVIAFAVWIAVYGAWFTFRQIQACMKKEGKGVIDNTTSTSAPSSPAPVTLASNNELA